MKGRPGSTWWLLRHEVRMYFGSMRKLRADGSEGGRGKLAISLWLLAQAALHGFAFLIVRGLQQAAMPTEHLAVMLNVVVLLAATLMLSTGLRGSVSALFERGDMDLLLSSPLPARSIFFTRLAGIAVSVAALFLFFLAPLANMGALTGSPHWLAIYPVIAGMALLAAALSMLATLALVRLLGARRTRVVAQVLGALSGAAFFLLSQFASNAGQRGEAVLRALLPGTAEAGWQRLLPGHALVGEPLPLLLLVAVAVAVFVVSGLTTQGFFLRGVEQAAGMARAGRAPRGGLRFRFGRGPFATVIAKEWRLIRRDLHLISQVLLHLLYMVPMLVIVIRSGDVVTGTASALVFVCASMAGALAWIVISAEDAPDLLAGAPLSPRTIQRAKVAAAALPPLALIAVPLLWVMLHAPWRAAILAVTAALATLSTVFIALWCGLPGKRSDFKTRGKGNVLGATLELFSTFSWAGVAWLLLGGSAGIGGAHYLQWSALSVAGALLALGVAWLFRRGPPAPVRPPAVLSAPL